MQYIRLTWCVLVGPVDLYPVQCSRIYGCCSLWVMCVAAAVLGGLHINDVEDAHQLP